MAEDKFGAIAWLTEEWIARLSSSIELMTEVAPVLKPGNHVPASAVPADALWLSIPLDLAGNAAVLIGAARESWLPIGTSALQAAGVADVIGEVSAKLPLGRTAVPDDVARVVLFCASDLAALMTGDTLLVDAGHMTV